MELAGSDALDEALVFFGIGLGEVVAEGSVGGEGPCRLRGAFGPCPWAVADDAQRARVWQLGNALLSEDALGDIEPFAGTELRRREADVDVFRIGKDDLVVVPGIACMSDDTCGRRLPVP